MMRRFNAGLFSFISGLSTSGLAAGLYAGIAANAESAFALAIAAPLLGAFGASGYLMGIKLKLQSAQVLFAFMAVSAVLSATSVYYLSGNQNWFSAILCAAGHLGVYRIISRGNSLRRI